MTIIPKPEGFATRISTLLAELGKSPWKKLSEDDASSVGFWVLAYFQGLRLLVSTRVTSQTVL